MANTVVQGPSGVNVTFDGSTAWDAATIFPQGVMLDSLQFIVVTANDLITVREGGIAAGRIILSAASATVKLPIVKYFNNSRLYKLYVVGNEASANSILIVTVK